MKRLRALILRVAGLFGGARRERELADELDSHLQMHIDDNLSRRHDRRAGAAGRDASAWWSRDDQTGVSREGHAAAGGECGGRSAVCGAAACEAPGFAATAIVVL